MPLLPQALHTLHHTLLAWVQNLPLHHTLRAAASVSHYVYLAILALLGVVYIAKSVSQAHSDQAKANTEARFANDLERTSQHDEYCERGKEEEHLAATDEYQAECESALPRPPPRRSEFHENDARPCYSLASAISLAELATIGVMTATQLSRFVELG